MTDQNAQPAAAATPAAEPPAQPRGPSVTDVQAREAFAATLEVLNGAQPGRILELADKIALAKLLLAQLVAGGLAIGNARAPAAAPAPAIPVQNRHARRSAKHRKR